MRFIKMHGIGNDFVLLDNLDGALDYSDAPGMSRHMCDRHFGIGADGLILVERGVAAPFRMRMFNPDGSESEMCGNGVRCVSRLLAELGEASAEALIETGAGVLKLENLPDGRVRVDMGPARLRRQEIGMLGPPQGTFIDEPLHIAGAELPATAVSMGNPHLVIFCPDVAAIDLQTLGPLLARHELFPNGVNVHFASVCDDRLMQRTWERGAGATLACGTGACAVAFSAYITGRASSSSTVALPGGELLIECSEGDRIFMTGPAEKSFEGEWNYAASPSFALSASSESPK